VCYPGREGRFTDPLAEYMEDLSGPLAAAFGCLPGLPTAFFGHSMGASVAYETALRLERDHGVARPPPSWTRSTRPRCGKRSRMWPG
jgi:surfactin synthase thioesterase subunit